MNGGTATGPAPAGFLPIIWKKTWISSVPATTETPISTTTEPATVHFTFRTRSSGEKEEWKRFRKGALPKNREMQKEKKKRKEPR